MLARRVDDDKVGQQTLQVQSHVGFGRSLASAVLGPVQATGHQLQDRRIHDMNGHLEAKGWSPTPPRYESRRLFAQVAQHLPKQLLRHLGGPFPVGMGKSVAAGCRCPANARQRPGVQLQGITQIIQADAMSQLGIGQTHHMAPGLEGARLILHPGCPRNFGNQMLRNIIANLTQDAALGPGWRHFEFIHPCRVAGERKKFQPILSNPVGWF